jgi:murein L,D-transpeptidase YcbB/YkuD
MQSASSDPGPRFLQPYPATLEFVVLLLVTVMFAAPALLQADNDDATTIISARVGQLLNGVEVKIGRAPIASTVVLPAFYERREFRPAWADPRNLDALLSAVRDSTAEGLNPLDYHLTDLEALRAAAPGPEREADLDMLATDALVRLAYHLRFGKVDVARIDPHWNFNRDYEAILFLAPAVALQEALDQGRIGEALAVLKPTHPLYAALRQTLATYRQIKAAGGWKPIAAGPAIRPGDSDPRVPALRERMAIEGDLDPGAVASGTGYSPALAQAMERFQERHGLGTDGAVGGKTLRLLNVPVDARIEQLRLSLERSRLIMHNLPDRLIVVNVPAFRLYYVEQGQARFVTNVVVGKLYAKTPIFRAKMTHIVINPSWTVPPVVMQRDIIPGLQKDPNYLKHKGLERVGGQIVQPPGPNNALGRIKLMFPNAHFVYLHDTPQQALFEKDSRTFSSGCVRVQGVFDLAERVIADPERWSKPRILEAVRTGQTQTVTLDSPLPVLIAYWTAGVGPDGRAFFYDDIYGRDAGELKALNSVFTFHPGAVSAARNAPTERRVLE